jgi:hypothetical protein
MPYHTYETTENLLKEQNAAVRLGQWWRGRILPSEQYASFDRVLVDLDGSTAALVEIKVRNYEMQFFIERHYLLSLSKVKSLRAAAKQRQAVPLVMVVCNDDDFLLDLRDESGTSLRKLPMNDRQHDHRTGEPVMRDEFMVAFAGSRFLPLFTLPRLL